MVRGHVRFAAIVNRSDLSLKLAVKGDIFINNTTCKPFLLYKAWYHLIYFYDFLFISISKDPLITIQTLHPTTGCLIRQAKIYQQGLPGLSLLPFKSVANFLFISRNHHLRVTAFFFIFSSFPLYLLTPCSTYTEPPCRLTWFKAGRKHLSVKADLSHRSGGRFLHWILYIHRFLLFFFFLQKIIWGKAQKSTTTQVRTKLQLLAYLHSAYRCRLLMGFGSSSSDNQRTKELTFYKEKVTPQLLYQVFTLEEQLQLQWLH